MSSLHLVPETAPKRLASVGSVRRWLTQRSAVETAATQPPTLLAGEVTPAFRIIDPEPLYAVLASLDITGDDIVRVTIDVTKVVVERESGDIPSVQVFLLGPTGEGDPA